MRMRPRPWYLLLLLTMLGQGWIDAQATPPSASNDSAQDAMSRDLLEVTIPSSSKCTAAINTPSPK